MIKLTKVAAVVVLAVATIACAQKTDTCESTWEVIKLDDNFSAALEQVANNNFKQQAERCANFYSISNRLGLKCQPTWTIGKSKSHASTDDPKSCYVKIEDIDVVIADVPVLSGGSLDFVYDFKAFGEVFEWEGTFK